MDTDLLHQIAQNTVDEPRVHQFPEIVKNRVLIADADVFSYKACDLEYSYGANVETLKELIDTWRKLAGAEVIELHLTMGKKGGREEIATVKPYQANRQVDPDKKDRVNDLRAFMAEYETDKVIPKPQYLQEADDSMTQAMWRDRNGNNRVLFSPDKDLWMVGGKHLNKDTLEIEDFPWDYGSTYSLVDSKGQKKLKGKGTSWFWHQMLMGDAADNIPGLPLMHKDLWIKYACTKQIKDLQLKLSTGRMPSGKLLTASQKSAAMHKYAEVYNSAKDKKVGGVLAHKYLDTCLNDRMAYDRVLEAYEKHYGTSGYDMFLEQGRLLWMRREENQDVMSWWREIRSHKL